MVNLQKYNFVSFLEWEVIAKMSNITTKQFQILTDINLVWDFFVEIYDKDRGGGVAAPFLSTRYNHRGWILLISI